MTIFAVFLEDGQTHYYQELVRILSAHSSTYPPSACVRLFRFFFPFLFVLSISFSLLYLSISENVMITNFSQCLMSYSVFLLPLLPSTYVKL